MKMILLLGALSLTSAGLFSQKMFNYNKGDRGIRVVIDNFHNSPPLCGILRNVSVFEAEVVDSLSVLQGTRILISVECKGDLYPIATGSQYLVNLSNETYILRGHV